MALSKARLNGPDSGAKSNASFPKGTPANDFLCKSMRRSRNSKFTISRFLRQTASKSGVSPWPWQFGTNALTSARASINKETTAACSSRTALIKGVDS
eukprot:CAMPEP_0169281198 /NCGR_PEP_ID=MMETSP1016-20121227/56090_1 /TAXON_ID=342587 /ORGANISM="Karlodinium micrum, Strain CCMP2283" /LENGTH=97 /DNA_ID=CAMNT_0009369729 /DNA_START=529 /DNA_END=822 /DNA_ORIENTATION=+